MIVVLPYIKEVSMNDKDVQVVTELNQLDKNYTSETPTEVLLRATCLQPPPQPQSHLLPHNRGIGESSLCLKHSRSFILNTYHVSTAGTDWDWR